MPCRGAASGRSDGHGGRLYYRVICRSAASDDAPHVIMTDHLIQRRAPANALAEFAERPAEEYRGEVTPYYPSPLPETPLNNLYRAVAQVGLENNVAAGLPELARLIDEIKPQEAEFYMVLGRWVEERGKKSRSGRGVPAGVADRSPIQCGLCALWRGRSVAGGADSRPCGTDCAQGRGIVVSIWRADIVRGEDSEGDRFRSMAAGSIAQAGGDHSLGDRR